MSKELMEMREYTVRLGAHMGRKVCTSRGGEKKRVLAKILE